MPIYFMTFSNAMSVFCSRPRGQGRKCLRRIGESKSTRDYNKERTGKRDMFQQRGGGKKGGGERKENKSQEKLLNGDTAMQRLEI